MDIGSRLARYQNNVRNLHERNWELTAARMFQRVYLRAFYGIHLMAFFQLMFLSMFQAQVESSTLPNWHCDQVAFSLHSHQMAAKRSDAPTRMLGIYCGEEFILILSTISFIALHSQRARCISIRAR